MAHTTAQEVFDGFESSFKDKNVVPYELEFLWLKKAVGRFCMEIEDISFDPGTGNFESVLPQYVIDTLAAYMKQSYQEREVSRVNKQISIVGKDLSIDGAGHSKTAAKAELEYCKQQSELMGSNQKPTAYV